MLKPFIENPSEWTVWIDLDDTLWDFRNNSLATLAEVYNEFGLQRYWAETEKWQTDYHLVNDALWEDYAVGKVTQHELRFRRFFDTLVNAKTPVSEARELAPRMDKYYLERLGKRPTLVDGAMELLDRLRERKYKIGILSNGFPDVQFSKMRSGKIADKIDVVVLSDELGINKPDVRIYRYAEQKGGVAASCCIMIGDNGDTDIAGAIKAGWPLAVWFNPRHKNMGKGLSDALSEGGGLNVISDLSEIDL